MTSAMVRTRLVFIVTMAALIAPWIAPCLARAPAGHAAMACCRKASDGAPVARPCCGPARDDRSTPPSSDATRLQPAQVMAVAVAPASPIAAPARADRHPTVVPPIAAPLRSTVLLI
jgi:hypothetical protein